MKNKILKTFFFFVLFSTLLVTASFAVEIKEDVTNYESDVYIIGSTRFDANQTITATMAANAGLNEAKVQVALGNNISKLNVTIYFYDAIFGDWYEINKAAKADLIEDTTTIKNIEDNLNIFYEEGVEKTLEVKYNGDVDKDSLPSNVEYKDGKFIVPATTFNFTFEDSNGVETKVNTNVDTNIKEGKEPTIEDVEIVPEWAVFQVNGEYFAQEKITEAILKSSMQYPAKLLRDVTTSEIIQIVSETPVSAVLDLNGKKLTTTSAVALNLKSANSSLKIVNNAETKGIIEGTELSGLGINVINFNDSISTLEIGKNVEVIGKKYGIELFGNNKNASIAALNVYGTVKATASYAITGNGTYNGTEINIYEGANIKSEDGIALYHPQEGVTNIFGGTITGKTAISMKSGELYITKGTLTATGEKLAVPGELNNGSKITGDVIYVESNAGYAGNVIIDITGGTLSSANSEIVRVCKTSSDKDITITGLYTTAHVDPENNNIICYRNDVATIKVGEINYAADSLDYALDLFAKGKEQQAMLLEDITTTEIIQIVSETPVSLILDLNGKKLTTTSAVALNLKSANSSLKIVNNAETKGIIEGTELSGLGINVINFNDSISTLEIGKNVEVIGKKYGIELFGNNKNASIAALNVYGTVKATASYAITGNGTYNGTEINIYEGANIKSEDGIALYIPQEGVTNIFGGTITGRTAIGTKAGTLNITGGALYATDSSISNEELVKKGNGIQITGDIIYVECNKGYADHVKINIDAELPVDEDSNVIRIFQPEGEPSIEGVTSEYLTASEPASITTNEGVNATVTTYAAK